MSAKSLKEFPFKDFATGYGALNRPGTLNRDPEYASRARLLGHSAGEFRLHKVASADWDCPFVDSPVSVLTIHEGAG